MGSPRQFDKLAEAVRAGGYSAAELLLPGHGGTARDFASGTYERWQDHVNAEIERFSRDHAEIWLAGHSMGGLLALNASISYSAHVQGVFTIASPLKLAIFSAHAAGTRLKQAFYRKSDPMKASYIANSSVSPSLSLAWNILPPAVELEKLMHATKKALPNVRAPVTSVYSSSDELTSIDSLELLRTGLSGAPFDHILLTDSLHAYYPEHEYAIIEQALMKFVFSRKKNAV